MAASCALCLSPIADGERFVTAGTEVFHRQCVAARGTRQSIGNRRHQRLVDLEGQLKQAEGTRRMLERQVSEQTAHVQHACDEVRQLRRDLEAARESAGEHAAQRDEYRRQRDTARRERDETVAARDAARRELALMQQLGQPAVSGPQTVADPAPQEDAAKDATATRFGLLELD